MLDFEYCGVTTANYEAFCNFSIQLNLLRQVFRDFYLLASRRSRTAATIFGTDT
jgi:hypothetical protein